jgi:enoyl-CoA hydratase/carnithine racemase
LPAALELAHKVTEKSAPVSVAIARQMMWRMMGAEHPMDAHKIDSRALQTRGQSSDVKEGIESFMQKRDPNFPNGVAGDFPAKLFADEPEFE